MESFTTLSSYRSTILRTSAIVFTLLPTSRNTWRGKAFLLREGGQK